MYLCAGFAFCEVIFFVASHTCNCKTFHIEYSTSAILIYHIVDCAHVVTFKHVEVKNVFTHKHLFLHFHNLILTIFVEDDDVVDVRAVAHIFIFLQSGAYEAFFAVDVEFFISLCHSCSLNVVKSAYHSVARICCTIFRFQIFIPFNCIIYYMVEVVEQCFNFIVV